MAGEKKEQSMLISLESLETANEAAEQPEVEPGHAFQEASGLIDLSALEGAVGGGGLPVDDTPLPAFEPASAIGVKARGGSSPVTLAAIVLIGGALLAGVGFLILRMLNPEPKPVVEAPTVVAVKPSPPPPTADPAVKAPDPKVPAAAAAKAPDAGTKAETTPAGSDGADPAKPKAKTKSRWKPRSKSAQAKAKTTPKPAATPKPKAAAPKPAAKPKPAGSSSEVDGLLAGLDGKKPAAAQKGAAPGLGNDDPLLPERLTRKQIMTTVRRNAAGVSRCKAETKGPDGTVMVQMVIKGEGKISQAKVTTAAVKGSPMATCIERKVKVFRFPQFRGDPMRINMPFAM
jgi:hypothetical protein